MCECGYRTKAEAPAHPPPRRRRDDDARRSAAADVMMMIRPCWRLLPVLMLVADIWGWRNAALLLLASPPGRMCYQMVSVTGKLDT